MTKANVTLCTSIYHAHTCILLSSEQDLVICYRVERHRSGETGLRDALYSSANGRRHTHTHDAKSMQPDMIERYRDNAIRRPRSPARRFGEVKDRAGQGVERGRRKIDAFLLCQKLVWVPKVKGVWDGEVDELLRGRVGGTERGTRIRLPAYIPPSPAPSKTLPPTRVCVCARQSDASRF